MKQKNHRHHNCEGDIRLFKQEIQGLQQSGSCLKFEPTTGSSQQDFHEDPARSHATTTTGQTSTLLVKLYGSDLPATRISLPSHWSLAQLKSSLQRVFSSVQLKSSLPPKNNSESISLTVQGRHLNQASDTKIQDIAGLEPYSILVCQFDHYSRLPGGMQQNNSQGSGEGKALSQEKKSVEEEASQLGVEVTEENKQKENDAKQSLVLAKENKSTEQLAAELGIAEEKNADDSRAQLLKSNTTSPVNAAKTNRTLIEKSKLNETVTPAKETSAKADFTKEQKDDAEAKNKVIEAKAAVTTNNTTAKKLGGNQVGVLEKLDEKAALMPKAKSGGGHSSTPADNLTDGAKLSSEEEKEDPRTLQELMDQFNKYDTEKKEKTHKTMSSTKLTQADKEILTKMDDFVRLIAKKQVKDYKLSEEEEQKLLEKHLHGYKSGGAHEIKSASEFINATSEARSFVEYLWATRGWQYDAFFCKIPGLDKIKDPVTYKLFVRESSQYSLKSIVSGHSFESPPEAFSLNGNTLWILEHPEGDNQCIKMITFKFKFGDERTEEVTERRFFLPEGVSVRRAASRSDDENSLKKQLIKNLDMQWSQEIESRGGPKQNNFATIQNEVNRMTSDNHSQILAMRYGKVYVNTKERGLVYFTMQLEGNKDGNKHFKLEDKRLTNEDLRDVADMQPGYVVTALFTDRRDNTLKIMSESDAERKVCMSVRQEVKKEYKEMDVFKVARPYPIVKADYLDGGRIFVLDTKGGAKVISTQQETIFDIGEQCCELLVTSQTLFTWRLQLDDNNNLTTVLHKRKIGNMDDKKFTSMLGATLLRTVKSSRADAKDLMAQKEAEEEQQSEGDGNTKLCEVLAQRDYIPSFFSHSLSVEGRMLLANGKTIYVRDDSTHEWLQCFQLDSILVEFYHVKTQRKNNMDGTVQLIPEILCVCEEKAQILELIVENRENPLKQKKDMKVPMPGIAIGGHKVLQSEWHDSNILIMTLGRDENYIKEQNEKAEPDKERKGVKIEDKSAWKRQVRLWACTPDLRLSLLLQDQERKYLDPNSFYAFVRVNNKYYEENLEEWDSSKFQECTDTLSLVCSVSGYRREFNLFPMPELSEKPTIAKNVAQLENAEPLIKSEPVTIKGLMQLDFENAKVHQLFEVNQRDQESGSVQRFYAMIANGKNLKTSIILLNQELKLNLHSDFDSLKITQVSDKIEQAGHIFALDDHLNLVKIDIDLLNKGGLAIYKLINFSEHGRTVLSVDSQSIWLLHASGVAQRLLKLPFTGKLQLEGYGSEDRGYLLWKQKEHILAAVNRFNVVSFWNTLTGELFHKKIITNPRDRIADARKYASHEYQKRYEEPGKQFDTVTQTLVCFWLEAYGIFRVNQHDESEYNKRVKIMKLHVFEENQRAFEASCEELVTAKINRNQIELGRSYFYNYELSTIVATTEDGSILFFKQQTELIDPENAEWIHDYSSSETVTNDIGLQGKGNHLLENHISPDGRYILHCIGEGLRVLEFAKHNTTDGEVIALQPRDWELPVRTDDLEPLELAQRVRFESNNVIRFFKPGYNRDFLFKLESDGKTVSYLSELQVENLFMKDDKHAFGSRSFENEFESFMNSNRLFRTSYWHRLNLDELKKQSKINLGADEEINRIDMISPVMRQGKGFVAQLAFSTFEWLQAEKVADGEILLDDVDIKRRLQLSMGIFPHATTLLHLIASKSSKEDQSLPAQQIEALLEAESAFADEELTGTEEGEQIKIPIIVNQLGKTPFKQMHDTGRRVLIDKLMGKIPFHRIINYQQEVSDLLQQEDPNLINFIESSLQENESTQKISSVDMPPSTYLITFRSTSTTLEQLEVQEEVNRSLKEKELASVLDCCSENRTVNTKVKVRFMDIRWFLRGGTGFLDFVTVLKNYKRDKLFTTDLLSSLTHEYWVVYQRKIIWRTLLPWIAYSGLSVVYFVHVLDANFATAEGSELLTWRIVAGVTIALVLYQLYIELRQIMGSIKDYFDSTYNLNDLFQYFGTLWIVVINLAEFNGMSKVSQRDLATIIILSQGVKAVIDWLRLFDVTSFYVTLIQRTVLDIGYFGLILFVMVAYIGVATYMLQLNAEVGEDNSIIPPVFENFFVDSVLNQYLLMLGEFQMDGFGEHVNAALCYGLFLLTTFIMQITFLNMLIAIMGDTFDKVIDQRPTFSLKNKLMILAGMETLIRSGEFDDSKVFLFVIQPAGADDGGGGDSESENWRGKVYYTHNLIKTRSAALSDEIQQVAREQKARVHQLTSLVSDQQGKMQRQLDDKVDRLLATTDLMLQRSGAGRRGGGSEPQDGPEAGGSAQGQIDGMQGKIEKMQGEMRDKFAQEQKWYTDMSKKLETNMKAILEKLNKE